MSDLIEFVNHGDDLEAHVGRHRFFAPEGLYWLKCQLAGATSVEFRKAKPESFERVGYRLVITFPGYGKLDDHLKNLLSEAFAAKGPIQQSIRPIAIDRRQGRALLDPAAVIMPYYITQYMARISAEHKVGNTWLGGFNGQHFTLEFEDSEADNTRLRELFNPVFAGLCTISASTVGMKPSWVIYKVVHGGVELQEKRAESLGFGNIQSLDTELNAVVGISHYQAQPNFNDMLHQAILFAQALGCYPVGDFTYHFTPTDRHVRTLSAVKKILPPLDQ